MAVTPTTTQWHSGAEDESAFGAFADLPQPDRAAVGGVHVAVIGAGAFGGWTALHLLRAGARVTLLDAWGPGNARASSGGETRVIRGVYGGDRAYVEWTAKALHMWRQYEDQWGERLYGRTGVLWMVGRDDRYVRAAQPLLSDVGLPYEELSNAQAASRFPQISFQGVEWALLEQHGGYLRAAHACRVVVDRFVAAGGTYRQIAALGDGLGGSGLASSGLSLSDGSVLAADRFVFACGPWLPALFPELLGERIVPSRQEIFYMGTPPGTTTYHEEHCPIWIDFAESIHYGFPATDSRGFKVANDARGGPIDPTTDDRVPSPDQLDGIRRYLGERFPGLAGAPLLEARVCQYANTADGHLLIDRHPADPNTWLVGGGSGHGFKLGPVLGEFVSRLVLGDHAPPPVFTAARMTRP